MGRVLGLLSKDEPWGSMFRVYMYWCLAIQCRLYLLILGDFLCSYQKLSFPFLIASFRALSLKMARASALEFSEMLRPFDPTSLALSTSLLLRACL